MKILCGQLNCLVKLADVATRCSSHPQGKSFTEQLNCLQRIFLCFMQIATENDVTSLIKALKALKMLLLQHRVPPESCLLHADTLL